MDTGKAIFFGLALIALAIFATDGMRPAYAAFMGSGFISGYNQTTDNGTADIVAGMSYNDTFRWAASWCRDTPSKDLADAVLALIISRIIKLAK